jgi:hypothetical protein
MLGTHVCLKTSTLETSSKCMKKSRDATPVTVTLAAARVTVTGMPATAEKLQ